MSAVSSPSGFWGRPSVLNILNALDDGVSCCILWAFCTTNGVFLTPSNPPIGTPPCGSWGELTVARVVGVLPYIVRSMADDAVSSPSTLSRWTVCRLSTSRSASSLNAAFTAPPPSGSHRAPQTPPPPLSRPASVTSRPHEDVLPASAFSVSAPANTDRLTAVPALESRSPPPNTTQSINQSINQSIISLLHS